MRRICIIGGGIAGLTCAWRLQHDAEVTLLEASDVVGGHAWTYVSPQGNVVNPFVVNYMRPMYPRFFELMAEIGFERFRPAPVYIVIHTNGRIVHADIPFDLRLLVRNLPTYLDWRSAPSVRHWGRFFRFLFRFFRDYKRGRFPPDMPITELERIYPEHTEIVNYWALPFAMLKSNITLTVRDVAHMLFEGISLRAFLDKDLAVTVDGAVADYAQLLASKTRGDVRVSSPVERLARRTDGRFDVEVLGQTHVFDRVVVATQPLAVPRFLEPWNDALQDAFVDIHEVYDPAWVVIHRDPVVFCGIPERLWGMGGLNYDPVARKTTVSINNRQLDGVDEQLFVTYMDDPGFDLPDPLDFSRIPWHLLPPGQRLDPDRVLDVRAVSHPLIGHPVQRARFDRLVDLSGRDGLYFAGVGLDGEHTAGHEGAVRSGEFVAARVLRDLRRLEARRFDASA